MDLDQITVHNAWKQPRMCHLWVWLKFPKTSQKWAGMGISHPNWQKIKLQQLKNYTAHQCQMSSVLVLPKHVRGWSSMRKYKSNMADGAIFKIGRIAITQQRNARFWWNSVCSCTIESSGPLILTNIIFHQKSWPQIRNDNVHDTEVRITVSVNPI